MHGIHRRLELGVVVADPHRAPAEDVGRADEDRVSDLSHRGDRLLGRRRDRPGRAAHAELLDEGAETRTVFCEVDRLVRSAEDAIAAFLDRAGELERRLASELGDDADRLLAIADGEDFLRRERLEVEPVGGVVVGRDRLRVAVDHDRLEPEGAEGLRGVHAAVVELDALSDPVRARPEDDHAGRIRIRQALVRLAPGGVEVVRPGLHLAGAGVDAPECWQNPLLVPATAHLHPTHSERSADRVVSPPGALRAKEVAGGQLLSRMLDLSQKPRVNAGRNVIQARPRSGRAFLELPRSERLEEGLGKGPADAHRLAHRLHLRSERAIRARELLEGEARKLDDHVVEGRLEARGSRLGEVVRDLLERVADRELRSDLGDRVAGRLGGERRGAGDARVHLDDAKLARLAAARELDVRAPGLDPDGADHGRRGVSELLVGLVGERHLRGDGDRVARVHPHRVQVLDRADDDHVVFSVADQLELELVPAPDRLLDQHLGDRRLGEAALDLAPERRGVLGEAAAVAAQGERRAYHRGQGDVFELGEGGDDARGRHLEAARTDGIPKLLTILGAADHLDGRADQLDSQLLEDARLGELDREVQGGLAAERRQERMRALALEHRGDALEIERLDVGAIGEAGVGHDRRRVRVDDDRAVAVLAQHLQGLAAGVVELAGLADDDRARADHAHALDVTAGGHQRVPSSSTQRSRMGQASCGPGPASG